MVQQTETSITNKGLIILRKKLGEVEGKFCLEHRDAFITGYLENDAGTPEEKEAASVLNGVGT